MKQPVQISKYPAVWLFIVFFIVLCALSVWVLRHNYLNEYAMLRWSQIMITLSAPEIRIEDFGLIYPVIPVYIMSIFYYLPGLSSPFVPYLLSSLFAAALLGLWFHHLREKGYSNGVSFLMVLLSACHPFFLWSAGTGTEKSLSLLMFYFLCLSFVRLTHHQDVRAFIMLGWVIALYFLIDQRAVFLFAGLLPLLVLLAPPRMLKESARSVYIIFSLPLAIIVSSWAYVNWVFRGNALRFFTEPESGFLGARLLVEQTPWLQKMGGYITEPTVIALIISAISFPSLLWVSVHAYHSKLLFRSAVVFFVHPLLALILATYLFFIDHPIGILFLFSPGLMAILMLMPRVNKHQQNIFLILLLLGNIGGVFSITYQPTEDMKNWYSAFSGRQLHSVYPEARRLGAWLAANRYRTLMDETSGYRAIIARGDAEGLILPKSNLFKLAFKHSVLGDLKDSRKAVVIEQIVVMNPDLPQAAKDKITQRYPTLYKQGLPGYEMVYNRDEWRVYRYRFQE